MCICQKVVRLNFFFTVQGCGYIVGLIGLVLVLISSKFGPILVWFWIFSVRIHLEEKAANISTSQGDFIKNNFTVMDLLEKFKSTNILLPKQSALPSWSVRSCPHQKSWSFILKYALGKGSKKKNSGIFH